MKKYNRLLFVIADRYGICKGKHEPDEEWKSRIIYSICGLMAYSSLWDEVDEEPISIVHIKKRIRVILESYKYLYPEVKNLNSINLENEINDIFQKSGIIYHCPNRIVPSLHKEASVDNTTFQRGLPIDDIKNISGLGMYSDINSPGDSLHNSRHIPDTEDAELITRFEMQQFCPDILITNYSMLEYMLLRPREQKIWMDTKTWLNDNPKNSLLFIIDEAHMYRGSSGGEVSLLIRRLFHKLWMNSQNSPKTVQQQ